MAQGGLLLSTVESGRPPPGVMRARTTFRQAAHATSLVRVRNQGEWPAAEFRVHFEVLMRNAGIPNAAELARQAGIDPSLISKWLNGRQQPSRGNLKKVAGPLGTSPVNLYIQAGLDDEEDLDISGQIDTTVVAAVYRELLDLDNDASTTDAERSFLRESVANLIAGVRGRRSASQPIGRRRSA